MPLLLHSLFLLRTLSFLFTIAFHFESFIYFFKSPFLVLIQTQYNARAECRSIANFAINICLIRKEKTSNVVTVFLDHYKTIKHKRFYASEKLQLLFLFCLFKKAMSNKCKPIFFINICCIFGPAFGCCAPQTLVKIFIFSTFYGD